jgi:hypothetical protein
MIRIMNPAAIVIETESIPALLDVCRLAHTLGADRRLALMTDADHKNAMDFAKRLIGMGIVYEDDNNDRRR